MSRKGGTKAANNGLPSADESGARSFSTKDEQRENSFLLRYGSNCNFVPWKNMIIKVGAESFHRLFIRYVKSGISYTHTELPATPTRRELESEEDFAARMEEHKDLVKLKRRLIFTEAETYVHKFQQICDTLMRFLSTESISHVKQHPSYERIEADLNTQAFGFVI